MPPDVEAALREWLHVTDRAIQAVPLLLAELPAEAAYHCQQGAEKLVKTVLVALDRDPPRTHEIERLLDLLPPGLEVVAALRPLMPLSDYAWQLRYPGPRERRITEPTTEAVAAWLEKLVAARAAVAAWLRSRGLPG